MKSFDWVFKTMAIGIASFVFTELKTMRESFNSMSVNLAVVTEKVLTHDRTILNGCKKGK